MPHLRTPHVVSRTRPIQTRDVGNNATEQDYAGSTDIEDVVCFFQPSNGKSAISTDGQEYRHDAVIFTKQDLLSVYDLVEVDLPGISGRFLVMGVQSKYVTRGMFSHFEASLMREPRR